MLLLLTNYSAVDVSTASVALESYFDINQVTFDFFDCSFGQVSEAVK